MNWEAIGATGEVLGAIAVVISLLYFSFQIRQNNRLLRESQRDQTQEQMTALRSLVLQRDMAEVIVNGLTQQGALDPVDEIRLATWLDQFVWTNFQVWDRYGQDPTDTTWSAAAAPRLGEILTTPGASDWWEHRKQEWNPDFVSEIDRIRSVAA